VYGFIQLSDAETKLKYRIGKNQQYAPICTTHFFYVLAPTCFGSSLPSSGSVLDPSELLEIQIEWVMYLKYITAKKNQYV
jgi:hypothetical protein